MTKEIKQPKQTLKSQGFAIFAQELVRRATGAFASNKEFRKHVLDRIANELNVTLVAASSKYNQAKQAAEALDPTLALGRDPKKVKVAREKKVKEATVVITETVAVKEADAV